MQVEVSKAYGLAEWREDLKRLLRRVGVDGKPVVFLLSDTQIKDETFLEVWMNDFSFWCGLTSVK